VAAPPPSPAESPPGPAPAGAGIAELAGRGQTLLAVFAGGALGTLTRAVLAHGLPHDPGAWPWATFAVNLLGAFLLGWWATRLLRAPDADPRARPFLATGVCGGLTTFSTLQLELVTLLRDGDLGLAVAYATASIVLGLGAVLGGRAAARRVAPGSRSGDGGPVGPAGTGGRDR
jgi:CrcB protein